MSAVLVACSHGTRSPAGREVVRRLVAALRSLDPTLDVRQAFVDVEEPRVPDVVRDVLREDAGRTVVVVPLLLSVGVHARHDIGAAVEVGRDGAAVAAGTLGPDPRLVTVLQERLVEAGVRPQDAVVLAAAGSSDPAAADDVEVVRAALQARRPGPVTVGYGAAARPTVPDAVAAARTAGARRVAVAAYLLAPGVFHSALAGSGADVVTAPLGPHPELARVALDRFRVASALTGVDPAITGEPPEERVAASRGARPQ